MKYSYKILSGVLPALLGAAVLDSCQEYSPDFSITYDYAEYENFRAITVTNPSDDHYISVYYEQPFSDEGGVQAKQYLGGIGPFEMELNVPSHVKQLYVVDNGELTVHPVADLHVGEDVTRSLGIESDELSALYDHVTSKYLITANYNVTGDDLFKCTDIRLERDGEHVNTELECFNISMIDLMKGNRPNDPNGEKKNFIGNLFAYIYPKEKMHHLTLNDCIFYGAAPDGTSTFVEHINKVHNEVGSTEKKICPLAVLTKEKLVEIGSLVQNKTYSGGMSAENVLKESGVWPLLNARHYGNAHIIFSIPKEYEGYNLGFVYLGGQNLRFTTPALNIGFWGPADRGQYGSSKDGNYLNYMLKYEGEYHGDFLLDRHVANGFIWHFTYNYNGIEKEYDVLGMDNQYPFNNKTFYDSDYADYKALITTDPEYLKPVEEIPIPRRDPFTLEEGYFLFEDTYPNEGDYDYNDAIVQYEWRYYPLDKTNRVNCTLEGYACTYTNTFGFRDGDGTLHPIFKDFTGRVNVASSPDYIDLEADGTQDVEYEFKGEKVAVSPYLYNGTGCVFQDKGGDFMYPYCLKIPYEDTSGQMTGAKFCWMIEGAPILTGYQSITADGWYKSVKDETKVMKRR